VNRGISPQEVKKQKNGPYIKTNYAYASASNQSEIAVGGGL
jgi:hypothetical protein